jgi:hypothetical protein
MGNGNEKMVQDTTFQDNWTLQPATFYPCISEVELTMWNHWLPTTTVFECRSQYARIAFFNRLKQLNAPQEVVEECQWAWTMELFEAYELKTPERRDLRDPLVLGRLGTQRYRMVLWGESLRPLEEIHELVQKSLTIRKRAAKWLLWSLSGGAAIGLTLGLWLAGQTPYGSDQLGVGLACMILGSLFMGLPFYIFTPENRQQHFLDRYRQ